MHYILNNATDLLNNGLYLVYNICALINNALYVNQRDYNILYNPLVSRATPPIARGKGVW